MNEDLEPKPASGEPINTDAWIGATPKNVQLNYFLYIVSVILGVTGIIGVIFAYMNRDKGDAVLQSHYTYQIRTFWIGILYTLISAILTILVIGIIGFIFVFIWFLVRCIKGLSAIGRKEAIANPGTWLW